MRTLTRTTARKLKEAAPPLEFDQLPDWITVEELARYLRIGRSCAYELVRSGQVASRRFGRLVRIEKRGVATSGNTVDPGR